MRCLNKQTVCSKHTRLGDGRFAFLLNLNDLKRSEGSYVLDEAVERWQWCLNHYRVNAKTSYRICDLYICLWYNLSRSLSFFCIPLKSFTFPMEFKWSSKLPKARQCKHKNAIRSFGLNARLDSDVMISNAVLHKICNTSMESTTNCCEELLY